MKVPKEFSRRTRCLSQNMKAEEYRNIILFFFVLILEALIDSNSLPLVRLWARMAYLSRCFYGDEEDFEKTTRDIRRQLTEDIIRGTIECFGQGAATYNLHLTHHWPLARAHGPFGTMSSTKFESYFASLRNCFTPGTQNIPAQAMRNCFLKQLKGHACRKEIAVVDVDTAKSDDTLVYQSRDGERDIDFYNVVERDGDYVTVRRVITCDLRVPGCLTLEWDKVGVFQFLYFGEETIRMPLCELSGKAILVTAGANLNSVIMCVPKNVLREQ